MIAVGPWIAGLWELLGLPAAARRPPAGRRRGRRPAHVDLLVPAGGRDRRSTRASRHRRRLPVPRAPRGLGHAAARRRRAPDHRRAVGQLLQARPRLDPGRRRAAHRRPGVRGRPLSDRLRRRRASPTCGAPSLSHCLERFAGARENYRQVRSGGVGRLHGRQLPRLRLHGPERLRGRGLQPRLQDDRRRARIADVLRGGHSSLLYPFRYERFATGDLHPVSHSPYPWS